MSVENDSEDELRKWAIDQARQFVPPGVTLEVLLDHAWKLIEFVKGTENREAD